MYGQIAGESAMRARSQQRGIPTAILPEIPEAGPRSSNCSSGRTGWAGQAMACLLLLGACLMWAAPLKAAPKADLWPFWSEHDPSSERSLDHSEWNDFLERYVVTGPKGVNLVRYQEVSTADEKRLQAYLDRLQEVPVRSLSRDQQFPYWVNLYNALTVHLILEHYPVETIKDIDISPGLFSAGPWDKKLVTIEGKQLSLNDIEHRILRPIWEEPRIHYAVNCASMGCPNLRRQAYTAQNTEAMLQAGAEEYINHPRGVQIDDGELIVSSIYTWFTEDFGGSDASVIEHLQQYAHDELKSRLADFRNIDDDRYDWSLNEAD
jgi:hypothetical protein